MLIEQLIDLENVRTENLLYEFLLRDPCLIERLSEAMGAALVGNNVSPIPSKFSFHM